MTATEVLTLFVEKSGRYDLLDADSGAPTARALHDLNAAQKWLDRELGYPKEDAWLVRTLKANDTMITFANARYVKRVFVQSELDPTEKMDIRWKPVYYDIETEVTAEYWPVKGVELVPTDTDRIIWIQAAWFSPVLDGDGVSFWTVQEPQLLIRAMSRELEIDMRNTQGVNDYQVPLSQEVRRIYQDLIAEEMAGPPEVWRML